MRARHNLENQRFGLLMILVYIGGGKYVIECDCGTIKVVRAGDLKSGDTRSCGCLSRKLASQRRITDRTTIEGRRFGLWTVIVFYDIYKYASRYIVECDYGTIKTVALASLLTGLSRSCGCRKAEIVGNSRRTHGMRQIREYYIWSTMVQRMTNPKNHKYYKYGGTDLDIDPRWLESFENFYEDMGMCPLDKKSIGRIDNKRGYWKDNCRWENDIEQANNRNDNVIIEHQGMKRTIAEWGRILKENVKFFYARKKRGWTDAEIMSIPKGGKRCT